ncbi:MAG: abortive infection family protein [Alphaproteobacteria bacterium]|nr:abortive infection family protein [Alphaproteobacteria bacterium]
MKISGPTIEVLANIITGGSNRENSGYRSGSELVNFFYSFGSTDIYSFGFPSRKDYVIDKLKEYNGTNAMVDIIIEALYPVHSTKETPNNEAAATLNKHLQKDGYKLIPNRIDCFTDEIGRQTYGDFLVFDVQPISGKTVEIANITKIDHQFINDQIRKANEKLAKGDYDGAITNARSLVEAFQEEIIRKSCAEVPQYDGDLQKLYKATKQTLNLDPSQKDLSDTLKQILTGLNSIISGISGLSNKMADRHSRSYKPSHHHAKLAVNVAFTFCEFLLDSYEYQQNQKISKSSGLLNTETL